MAWSRAAATGAGPVLGASKAGRAVGSRRQRRRGRPLASGGRVEAAQGGRPESPELAPEVAAELESLAGEMAAKLKGRLAAATQAYRQDRYREAARLLRQVVDAVPDSPSARELYGLTLYRLGRWSEALRQLQAHHRLEGSWDQYPVMADCYRALGRFSRAEQLWNELRRASPDPDVLAEGRLVAAGTLADQGRLREAVALLERAARPLRRPKARHLRTWYALADLYERAGEIPRARDLFARVASWDPELSDAAQRARALA